MSDDAGGNLGANIRQLRETRGLTQQQLASMSGIPRATWANMESGLANPTLSVLVRAAGALGVSLEELVGPPRATGKLFRVAELRVERRGKVIVRKLLPESVSGLELERLELPRGTSMTGVPHTPGTREYLACEMGVIELTASGETWSLGPGDVVVFRGDQKHSYRNPSDSMAIGYSVISFAR